MLTPEEFLNTFNDYDRVTHYRDKAMYRVKLFEAYEKLYNEHQKLEITSNCITVLTRDLKS